MISFAIPFKCLAPSPLVSAMIGPLRALTCSMLFRFLEKTASSGAMKTEGRSGPHQRDDAVFQFRARMAFGEKIGDLFHLQRAFQRDRKIKLAAEEQAFPSASTYFFAIARI